MPVIAEGIRYVALCGQMEKLVFLRKFNFSCPFYCGRIVQTSTSAMHEVRENGKITLTTVVDHIVPHYGDPLLFLGGKLTAPLQGLPW